jgi:uncharacterized protein YbbC (DUF1343 family)
MCGGAQIHVLDQATFRPVRTAVAVLTAVRELAGEELRWRDPPYEYETRKRPIDILWGHDGLRHGVDAGEGPDEIMAGAERGLAAFDAEVAPYLLYD